MKHKSILRKMAVAVLSIDDLIIFLMSSECFVNCNAPELIK